MPAVNIDLLSRGLAVLNLDPGEDRLPRLVKYIEEIELWNPAYGLVKAAGDELVVKHILDSLAALPVLRKLGLPLDRVADLGSGAGLPGIPLALFLPESKLTLVERMEKRVRFLENQKARLGLANVQIVQAEAERVPGSFDLVTFRAFRPFSERKLFLGVTKLVPPGGAIAAYKGRLDTAREELAALSTDPILGPWAARAEVLPLSVPFLEEERCLVILRGQVEKADRGNIQTLF